MAAVNGHAVEPLRYAFSYNDIHETIGRVAAVLRQEFRPDLIVAIGGGGFIPCSFMLFSLRVSKPTYLQSAHTAEFPKVSGQEEHPNPVRLDASPQAQSHDQTRAIGLNLYEELGVTDGISKAGKEVVRTQWLDFSTMAGRNLLGRRILIVDEVDDSRMTLAYACSELKRDFEEQLARLAPEARAGMTPELAVFVVHNKVRPKAAELPPDVKYFAGLHVPSQDGVSPWIEYPWESQDILAHDERAKQRPHIAIE